MTGIINLAQIAWGNANEKFSDYNTFKKIYPNIILGTHFDEASFDFLKKYLNSKCTRAVIEFPYFDWEYLSTVYTYYIKAMKPAIKECYRIHFYTDERYMGYVVLRPTPYSHIGRIQMDPRAFLHSQAYVITNEYNSNIMGVDESLRGFQFSTQDPEIAMCAQVAAWAILECTAKFGWATNRMKLAGITGMTWTFPERQIPAKGLTIKNIMEVLSSAGLYPILRSSLNDPITKGEIFAYIESGIPIIGLMSATNHAVCIIGHGEVDIPKNLQYIDEYCENDNGKSSNVIMHYKFIRDLIVNDDNYAPYMHLPCAGRFFVRGQLAYNAATIDSFIIPLSEKMYMTYDTVYSSVMAYLNSHENEFPEPKIVRIYLTLAKKYKSHILQAIQNPHDNLLKKIICSLNMPSFIWCVEISGYETFKNSEVNCQFIFDSTRHSEDNKPWLLIQSLKNIFYFDGEIYKNVPFTITDSYNQYRGNLEECTP